MTELAINISSASVNDEALENLRQSIANEPNCNLVSLSQTKSFDGLSDLIVILSIGGGVVVKQAANIVVAWINRNKGKNLNYKDIKISGYSAEEVREIIKQLEDE